MGPKTGLNNRALAPDVVSEDHRMVQSLSLVVWAGRLPSSAFLNTC